MLLFTEMANDLHQLKLAVDNNKDQLTSGLSVLLHFLLLVITSYVTDWYLCCVCVQWPRRWRSCRSLTLSVRVLLPSNISSTSSSTTVRSLIFGHIRKMHICTLPTYVYMSFSIGFKYRNLLSSGLDCVWVQLLLLQQWVSVLEWVQRLVWNTASPLDHSPHWHAVGKTVRRSFKCLS